MGFFDAQRAPSRSRRCDDRGRGARGLAGVLLARGVGLERSAPRSRSYDRQGEPPAPDMVRLHVVNGGVDPVTVHQALIDDAVWSFTIEPDPTIGRLREATGSTFRIRGSRGSPFTSSHLAQRRRVPGGGRGGHRIAAGEPRLADPPRAAGFYVGVVPWRSAWRPIRSFGSWGGGGSTSSSPSPWDRSPFSSSTPWERRSSRRGRRRGDITRTVLVWMVALVTVSASWRSLPAVAVAERSPARCFVLHRARHRPSQHGRWPGHCRRSPPARSDWDLPRRRIDARQDHRGNRNRGAASAGPAATAHTSWPTLPPPAPRLLLGLRIVAWALDLPGPRLLGDRRGSDLGCSLLSWLDLLLTGREGAAAQPRAGEVLVGAAVWESAPTYVIALLVPALASV